LLLDLDIIKYKDQLQLKDLGHKRMIFCIIRKKWLVSTPEELVRQLFLLFLANEKGFSKTSINVEKALRVSNTNKRFDIVVYSKNGLPQILIECKAPLIKLDQKVFDQASRYNIELKAPFLIITNGRQAYCAQINFDLKKFDFLKQLPSNTLVNFMIDHNSN